MNKFNHLPDNIRIKYCIKGDKYFRLYNCARNYLSFENLTNLILENNKNFSAKMYIYNFIDKEEKEIFSNDDLIEFINSKSFYSYYDSKYNCMKIQFTKEVNKKCIKEVNSNKNKELINDQNALVSLDHMFDIFVQNDKAKTDLINFLQNKSLLPSNFESEENENLLRNLMNNIKESLDNFIASKSSSDKLKLEMSIPNLEDSHSEATTEVLNFSRIFNINEMNLVSNEDIIRDSSVFRTNK